MLYVNLIGTVLIVDILYGMYNYYSRMCRYVYVNYFAIATQHERPYSYLSILNILRTYNWDVFFISNTVQVNFDQE